MGRIEAKLDRLIIDMETIKAQNHESAKANSQAEANFKTLFTWKSAIEERMTAIERKQSDR